MILPSFIDRDFGNNSNGGFGLGNGCGLLEALVELVEILTGNGVLGSGRCH